MSLSGAFRTLEEAMVGRLIEVLGVSKTYVSHASGSLDALRNIHLSVDEGEFVALLGPSGCGKTSLLRLMAGLEVPSLGRILINSQEVRGPASEVAFVFQSPVLLPWRSILSNVLLPAELAGNISDELREKAQALLEATGLGGFQGHLPRELSGGMRQRAAICRALLLDAPILLMDEPFGALDAMTRDTMNHDLFNLWRSTKKTIIFVTHDIAEAARLASRVVVMSPRPGRIAEVISTDTALVDDYLERSESLAFLETTKRLRVLFAQPNPTGRAV